MEDQQTYSETAEGSTYVEAKGSIKQSSQRDKKLEPSVMAAEECTPSERIIQKDVSVDQQGLEIMQLDDIDDQQPEWSIKCNNTKTEYSNAYPASNKQHPVQTFSTRDLISWSYQIARGMDYLASKKVLCNYIFIKLKKVRSLDDAAFFYTDSSCRSYMVI